MRALAGVLGGFLVVAVWVNVAITLVLPRGRIGFLKLVDGFLEGCYSMVGRWLGTYQRRDMLRATQPVAVLGLMLVVWLAGFVVAFGLLEWSIGGTFGSALREAGSSLFTLGFALRSGASPTAVDFLAAASGLVVVALQIAYLPTMYSAFNRRETLVTLLTPRAGIPAWGPEILARAAAVGVLDGLPALFEAWETWSADVAESHSSYPVLLRFRSPHPYTSWIVAQLAVLDACALHLATRPSKAPMQARLCLQMGFTCLRQLTRTLHLAVDEDPRPDGPLSLTYEEFTEGWDRMVGAGFPVECSQEEAWRHFRGWRVNYETAANLLCYGLDVVPARWTGVRRSGTAPVAALRFANRTPDNPEDHPFTTEELNRRAGSDPPGGGVTSGSGPPCPEERPVRFVILGGGPAGTQAATYAARMGVQVVLIERDVVGGAADLWDCIPSKAMIATGGAMAFLGRVPGMGITEVGGDLDLERLRSRIQWVTERLGRSTESILSSQHVELVRGTGRLSGPNTVVAQTAEGERTFEADAILLSTGSRPRIPEWADLDGDRVLSTRDAYPPKELPEHLVVIGSGVTGVEFVHMFSSLGSAVTLIVSRQQVLPTKDPEVAAVLEDDFLRRGVKLMKGARAVAIERTADGVSVHCDDGRVAKGSHALLAIGSMPNSEGLGLAEAGVEIGAGGYVPINHHCQTNIGHIYAAGDLSGKLPLSSVAAMQGRKIAEHVTVGHTVSHRHLNYDKAASAIFTEPEIADVGLAEADAFAEGRKIRVTKVPFAASARALINNDARGFVKLISDPATGVVLGGSIVGQNAAELISVIALAVTAGLRVQDIVESMLVHPTLSEALAEAAD